MRDAPRVAVVGAGAFGGWTALWLARAGCDVTLVDAWGPGNARASSGGESRVLRRSYGTDRRSTAMAGEALDLWRAFERERGLQLFEERGLLWLVESEDDANERASLDVLREVGVEPEVLDPDALARRYPQIASDGLRWAFHEPGAGVLLARRACAEVRDALVDAGGRYVTARAALGTATGARLDCLTLSDGSGLEADRFVLATGPWSAEVLPLLREHLTVTRQEVFYFGLPAGDRDHGRLPVWMDHGERFWYGIPATEDRGFKLADDTRGGPIDPNDDDRTPSADGLERARAALARRFPGLSGAPLLEARVCQYTETRDEAFILDRHPDRENVWLATGGSGHGFKHGPAVGRHVAQLVLGRTSTEPDYALARLGSPPESI